MTFERGGEALSVGVDGTSAHLLRVSKASSIVPDPCTKASLSRKAISSGASLTTPGSQTDDHVFGTKRMRRAPSSATLHTAGERSKSSVSGRVEVRDPFSVSFRQLSAHNGAQAVSSSALEAQHSVSSDEEHARSSLRGSGQALLRAAQQPPEDYGGASSSQGGVLRR